jgi:two-component system chemotaxis sensor kinase CheA
MTLMIVDALLFEVGEQALAIPQLVLREILQLDPAAITRIENNEVIPYRDGVLPLISLKRSFNIPAPETGRFVLIVGADNQMTGLMVDNIIGLREIVVHPVTDPLVALPGIAGATELTNGRVSLIIDAAAIVRRGREDARPGRLAAPSRTRRLTRELAT